MALIQSKYGDVVARLAPGDVLAFGGHHPFSNIIKAAAGSTVSHCALVKSAAQGAQDARMVQSVLRLDQPRLSLGVTEDPCADVLTYQGDVWWLPMHPNLRTHTFDAGAFAAFLDQKKKAFFDLFSGAYIVVYSFLKRLKLGFPQFRYDELDFMCCSEFVSAALKAGKLAPNADQNVTSPADVCEWDLYGPDYHQFKIGPTAIPNVNSKKPERHNATGGAGFWRQALEQWVRSEFQRNGIGVPPPIQNDLNDLLKPPTG